MAFSNLLNRIKGEKSPSSSNNKLADDPLSTRAHQSGDIFKEAEYFSIAEADIDGQWQNLIWPMIEHCDFGTVVDLAAGHGRNTTKLLTVAQKVIIVDINQECIDFCRERFGKNKKITYLKNDGYSLKGIRDNSVSLIYSFDSMVHFDNEVIQSYLKEIFRVLKPGGRGFIHHSNYVGNPGGNFMENPHCRNFMSKELFAHYCIRAGMNIIQQKPLDWELPALDCLTVFEKPL